MQVEWIKKNIVDLKKLYEKSAGEQALSSYIISVIRLLNGMVQIANGGFHRYERIILGKAIKSFCEHFQEQVQCALDCVDDVREKNEIILDIEDAVMQIAQVYKNVIDSTANADKRMFMSLAVDTSLYEFSPKLCGLYAHVLEQLVILMDVSGTGQPDYAFLIHPTLESNIKAKVLFKKRENSGKVVVVYIPVNILDQTDLIPVIALHEAFHVLTKRERERKYRARLLMRVMLLGMEDYLFGDVILCEDDKSLDRRRKSQLMEIWFGKIRDDFMRECNELNEDNRCWYGEKLLQSVTRKLIEGLRCAIEFLEQSKFIELYIGETGNGFKKCVEEYQNMSEKSMYILRNMHKVIIGDTLYKMLDRYIHILQEAYADVACIVIAQLKPELYDMAFECSVQFKTQKKYFKDEDREMRRMLVYDTVIFYSEELGQQWRENKIKKHDDDSEFGNLWFYDENMLNIARQNREKCVKIPMVYLGCLDYLGKCIQNLQIIAQNHKIDKFRKKLNGIMADRDDVVLKILGGVEVENETDYC